MFRRFNERELEEQAREDARLGIYDPEPYIIATIGPEPSFDPVGNLRHANVGSRLQNPTIEETEADMRREEDEMARHPSMHLLVTFLMVLLFMECAGSIYVMRTMGVESPERVIFGTALAVCIFFVTWLCSRARNRAISLAAIAALGLLVAALTVIRVDENTGGGSSAVGWATALVMMAVTVGPAVMAEHVLRLISPVLPIVRRRYRLRRRASQARFGQRTATWFVNRLASRREEWQQTAARIRSSYDIAHRRARAALGEEAVPPTSTNAVVPYRNTTDFPRKENRDHDQNAVIEAEVISPSLVEVPTAGSGRGADLMQPAIGAFNRASKRFTITPVYVDPVPERAATLARRGALRGIDARAIEARIEEVLPTLKKDKFPLIVSVDNPEAIASVLDAAATGGRPVLVYFLVRMPNEELLGIRAVLEENDVENQRMGARFFRKLAEVTARSGAAAVVGSQGRPEHLAMEPAYRSWFAEHMNANMTKLVAHIRPESDPFEVTTDGRKTMSLMLRDSSGGWSDPTELARSIVEHPSMPVVRGKDFAVGEIGPDGVRVHVLRVRATDGKPAINSSAIVSPDAYRAADAERREAIRRELAEAVARAERQTVTRTRPVFTTD